MLQYFKIFAQLSTGRVIVSASGKQPNAKLLSTKIVVQGDADVTGKTYIVDN